MTTKLPHVAIIVLNWNRRDDTLACLASLSRLDYASREIIVVDNGSSDNSVAAIRAAYPRVTLFEMDDNLGFVGGNNIGLEYANTIGASYTLLLNNDTQVALDSLRLLVDAAASDSRVGVVGPTIYYFDQPDIVWSAGGYIDWNRGDTYMIGLDERDEGQFGESPRSVDYVTGCALLFNMSLIERVGLLDARFFAYYEEAEWCVRVAQAGFKLLHVPQAKVWHKISPADQAASPTVHYYMTRNRLLFLRAARASWRAWAYTLFLDYLRTLASWSLHPRWRGMRAQRTVMLRAISDYFAGRYGRVSLESL